MADGLLDVQGGFGSLGVEFGDEWFSMTEIVGVDGVGLPGEVSPGFDLD